MFGGAVVLHPSFDEPAPAAGAAAPALQVCFVESRPPSSQRHGLGG
jgi:hypothetical protein